MPRSLALTPSQAAKPRCCTLTRTPRALLAASTGASRRRTPRGAATASRSTWASATSPSTRARSPRPSPSRAARSTSG
eukprot:261330-Prymnesium_polylepis.1